MLTRWHFRSELTSRRRAEVREADAGGSHVAASRVTPRSLKTIDRHGAARVEGAEFCAGEGAPRGGGGAQGAPAQHDGEVRQDERAVGTEVLGLGRMQRRPVRRPGPRRAEPRPELGRRRRVFPPPIGALRAGGLRPPRPRQRVARPRPMVRQHDDGRRRGIQRGRHTPRGGVYARRPDARLLSRPLGVPSLAPPSGPSTAPPPSVCMHRERHALLSGTRRRVVSSSSVFSPAHRSLARRRPSRCT